VEAFAVGWLLGKRFKDLPTIFHHHTALLPELPCYFNSTVAKRVARRAGGMADWLLPRQASHNIVFDHHHADYCGKAGVPRDRISVIPPSLDGSEISVAIDHATKSHFPTLVYSGNADPYQNLELLASAFQIARARERNLQLRLVTHHSPEAFSKYFDLNDPAIEVVVAQGVDELAQELGNADVGVCPRVMWSGVPIKVLNYLQARTPVVVCREAAVSISQEQGVVVGDTPQEFAEGILRALGMDRLRTSDSTLELSNQIWQYEAVYQQAAAAP
jgi:glycosyltransferase involved in cell wall biosynthesis